MASIADTLVQSALTQATGKQAQEGAESVAKLAEHIGNVQLKRQQIEQQKQDLQNAKLDKFMGALSKGQKFESKARTNYYQKFLPRLRDSLGLTETFPDETLQFAVSTNSNLARVTALQSKVLRGEITAQEAIGILGDPERFADVAPELKEGLFAGEPGQVTQEAAAGFLGAEKTRQGNLAQQQRLGVTQEQNVLKETSSLRKELTAHPVSKETVQINSAFDRVKGAFQEEPSAAGDLSGIFAYMKMLDPGSVVREGEFANAQNAASVPDRIRNAYNKVVSGERLNPQQRNDFFSQSKKIKTAQEKRQDAINSQFLGVARIRGLDPKQVFAGIDPTKAKTSSKKPSAKLDENAVIDQAASALKQGLSQAGELTAAKAAELKKALQQKYKDNPRIVQGILKQLGIE